MGAFRVHSTHCEGDGVSYDGLKTLTAANGDTITGTCITHWVMSRATVQVTGWLDIDGGTGAGVPHLPQEAGVPRPAAQ